jgi:predicted exporter
LRAPALLVGWLLLLGLWAWGLSQVLRVSTDLTLFMPSARSEVQQLLLSQLREGPGARLTLVAVEGDDPATLARVSKRLSSELRNSEHYLRVENGQPSDFGALQAVLMEHRYLLSPAVSAERFTVEGLSTALQERLHDLASPAAVLWQDLLPRDPTGELLAIVDEWQPADAPRLQEGVWFSADGQRALLLTETRVGGFDSEGQVAAVEALEQAFAQAAQGSSARMQATGPGPFGVAIATQTRRDAELFSVVDSIVLALILLLAYRMPRLVLLTGLPLMTGVLMGLSMVMLVYGEIHGITLAFGSTLLGVALDYPVHVFSHRLPGDAWKGLRHNWPTLWTSVVMACVAYVALIFTDFPGLAQLGVFTVAGLVSAATVTRWLLPALLPDQAVDIAASRVSRWQQRIDRWPRRGWLAPGLVLASVLVISLSPHPLWQNNLSTLSPVPEELQKADGELRRELGTADLRYLVLVTAPSAEAALVLSESLVPRLQQWMAQGVLSGYDMAARYLPSMATQRARQSALPASSTLQHDLDTAVRDSPFQPGLFTPFLADVEQARGQSPLQPRQLPDSVLRTRVRALLQEQPQAWFALVPLHGLEHPARLHDALAEQAGQVRLLDLKAESELMVSDFRDELLWRVALGVLVMVLLMVVGLRARQAIRLVILPTAATVLCVVAVYNVIGIALSLFHLVALMLVVGISIDYALYLSREEDDSLARARSLHSLLICCLATAAAFGILALSQIPVLRAIGATVASGVILGLVLGVLGARSAIQDEASPRI